MSDDTLRVVMMRFAQLYFVVGRGDKQKKPHLRLVLIRMFNTTFVGVDVLGDPKQTNFGRELVFSADL